MLPDYSTEIKVLVLTQPALSISVVSWNLGLTEQNHLMEGPCLLDSFLSLAFYRFGITKSWLDPRRC